MQKKKTIQDEKREDVMPAATLLARQGLARSHLGSRSRGLRASFALSQG